MTREPLSESEAASRMQHRHQVEASCLGMVIHDPSLLDVADLGVVLSNDYHRLVWGCLRKLRVTGQEIDYLSVVRALTESNGKCYQERAAEFAHWVRVHEFRPTRKGLVGYVQWLRVREFESRMVQLDEDTRALRADGAPTEQIESLRARAIELAQADLSSDPSEPWRIALNPSGQRLSTGWSTLDEAIGHVEPGMVLTLLAKAGAGKSYWASQLCVNLREAGERVVFGSLEMPEALTWTRLMRQYHGWTTGQLERVRDGSLAIDPGWEGVAAGLLVLHRPGCTVEHLEAAAKRHRASVVVIDYLQYIAADARLNRYEAVSRQTRQIKELAKRCHVLVVLLSQVKRNSERNSRKSAQHQPPSLEDARDSGTIEENADVLLGLWRDEHDSAAINLRPLKIREGGQVRNVSLVAEWATGRITSEVQTWRPV